MTLAALLEKEADAHEAVDAYALVLQENKNDASAVGGLERLFAEEAVRVEVSRLLDPVYDTRRRRVGEMMYEQMPEEWQQWLDLTPLERFRRSEVIFALCTNERASGPCRQRYGASVIPGPGRTHFPVPGDPSLTGRGCRMKVRT